MTGRRDKVVSLMREAQATLCAAFEALDGAGRFQSKSWDRPGGGGGMARVLSGGGVFEKAGVNFSLVFGEQTPPALWQAHPGVKGHGYAATGVSLVAHPRNPFAPAFHANFRYFEAGDEAWFGGGMDLTPSYVFEEDGRQFHRALRDYCQRHGADYALLKRTCDDYFAIKHRHEMRGIGGLFFDEISLGSFERDFGFVADGIKAIVAAYFPIANRRKGTAYGERERAWQLMRRGRYAEFNLVYDRGTLFGLQTQGNIEAILMSLPPLAAWGFDQVPEPGSPEAETLGFLQPREWTD